MTMKQLLLTLPLLLPLPAAAIVNMAEMHLKEYQEGVTGELELGLDGADGNSNYREQRLAGRVEWLHEGTLDVLQASKRFGDAAGTTISDQGLLHARHVQPFSDTFDWEAFVQLSYNKLARLSSRRLLGGGLRQELIRTDKGILLLGYGAFHYEEEIDDSFIDGGTKSGTRGNLYLILRLPLGSNSRLSSTTYYQPRLDETDDYRLIETASLTVDINDSLALKLGVDYTRDNAPPQGVEKADLHYTTGLSYRF